MEINITKQELIDFEKEIISLFKETKIKTPVHLSGGNEEQLIEIFKEIKPEDYVFSTHRSHYHYLLKGGSIQELRKMILDGKSMHIFDRKLNFFSSSIVAGCAAIATGVALALKKKNSSQHVWCFIGDGAEEEGHFYEAVRYVDGWKLPCIFIIEDNNRSVATPKIDRYNESEINWPSCVKRYYYKPTYPHYGDGTFVDFSKCDIPIIQPYEKSVSLDISDKNKESKMSYKEAIKISMENLAKDPKTIFLGYNVKYGNRGYGTFINIPEAQLLETPLAENLMCGLAMGLAIEGFHPIVFFERHDFILNAMDNIINHLDKIEKMSYGEFTSPIIIRATIGSKAPIYPGPQHTQDFTKTFQELLCMPIYQPKNSNEILSTYNSLNDFNQSALIIEERDLYEKTWI